MHFTSWHKSEAQQPMGSRMEIKKVAHVALVALLGTGCLMALTRTVKGDWQGNPTDEQISEAAELLSMPHRKTVTSRSRISKLNFYGEVVEAECACSADSSINHFKRLAEQHDWREIRSQKNRSGWNIAYCKGVISYPYRGGWGRHNQNLCWGILGIEAIW